jgi:cytochrome c-type biogenesis protein CcsB
MEAILLKASMLAYSIGTIAGAVHLVRPRNLARSAATVALAFGFLLQAAAFVYRAIESGTFAVSSFGEQISFFACLIAGGYLLAQVRYHLAVIGAMVGPIGFIGALAMLVAHGGVRDVPPDLQSPWLPVHVTLAFLGNAAFGLACLVSFVYLWQERQLKSHTVGRFLRRLPPLETLDDINFRFLTWGFILLTLGILSGVLWAELSFGRLWSWEPRTIWTTIIWIIYAVLLHGRVTVGWGGRRAATLTIVGFGVLFVSFIGVNMLAPGRHAVSFE